ncbi:MAG TPA: hypothetical protein VI230_08065 [Ignavibacteriaceae bacterium]
MVKYVLVLIFTSVILLSGCGTPNDPESVMGGDGGYKIVSKHPTSAFAQDILVDDTLAYIAQGEGGLTIINVKSPSNPSVVTVLTEQLRGYSYKLAIKDTIIYIASGLFGVTSINVVNPVNPIVEGNNRNVKPAKDFCIFNNFLFTAISEEGVNIAWLGDDARYPDIRGGMITPGYAQGVAISSDSNYALVAIGEMGLSFYDISQMGTGGGIYPLFKIVDTDGYAENVTINPFSPIAYVACGTGGLAIVDYSDSIDIKLAGNFVTTGYAKEVYYQNDKIYIATETRGLQIIDVADPQNPVRLGTVATMYAKGVTADDNYIYVADEDEGLIIVSIPK